MRDPILRKLGFFAVTLAAVKLEHWRPGVSRRSRFSSTSLQ